MAHDLSAVWPVPAAADDADFQLAAAYAPILLATADEPYPPQVYGYSVVRRQTPSLSSKFLLAPRGAAVIEYAVWYDYDIGHLYDLEHVWVHLDADGTVLLVEASRHGNRRDMAGCAFEGKHPILAVETGKHAHWPTVEAMAPAHGFITVACDRLAGEEGVHLGNKFAETGLYSVTPFEHRLARLKMGADRLRPDFSKWQSFSTETIRLVPWPSLADWIPRRVRHLVDGLKTTVPHLKAVFLDCGDTLVDEESEVKLPGTEVVIASHLIPGARALLETLTERGYRLALVADGPRATFETALKPRRMWEQFDAHIISEDVGVHKPDARMFDAAFAALGLSREDAGQVVMVGNNLERDIAGANRLGITSVFMGWSKRRTHEPANADEVPAHRIYALADLPDVLLRIEEAMQARPEA